MQIIYVASDLKSKQSFFVTAKGSKVMSGSWRVACAAIDKKGLVSI